MPRTGPILSLIVDTETSHRERVLVVEDEADLGSSLAYALRANGYDAMVADRGELALSALGSFHPDLVLLDLMLPDMSGLEICRRLRNSPSPDQPAIVILSARAQEIDRVVGLEVGADDYVVKPFSVRELMLRIEARLRARKAASATTVAQTAASVDSSMKSFSLRNLRVDESAHRAFVDEKEIHVSALEMRVLIFLFRSPGKMRTRKELLTEVWGYHPEVESRTVDTHIKRLRDKLVTAADLLQTVRGVGFRLANPALPNAPSDNATQQKSLADAGSKNLVPPGAHMPKKPQGNKVR
jgi:two-component system phosphate regulon response regulator PhoB